MVRGVNKQKTTVVCHGFLIECYDRVIVLHSVLTYTQMQYTKCNKF